MTEAQERPIVLLLKQMDQLIKQCGNNTGFDFVSIYDFVLRLGKSYEYAKLSKKYPVMTPKHCFENAAELSFKHNLVYVEGYALIDNMPLLIHHAWCCKPGSNVVIDPTTTNLREYYGVPFQRSVVEENYYRIDGVTCLLDDWERDWPILRLKEAEARKLMAA